MWREHPHVRKDIVSEQVGSVPPAEPPVSPWSSPLLDSAPTPAPRPPSPSEAAGTARGEAEDGSRAENASPGGAAEPTPVESPTTVESEETAPAEREESAAAEGEPAEGGSAESESAESEPEEPEPPEPEPEPAPAARRRWLWLGLAIAAGAGGVVAASAAVVYLMLGLLRPEVPAVGECLADGATGYDLIVVDCDSEQAYWVVAGYDGTWSHQEFLQAAEDRVCRHYPGTQQALWVAEGRSLRGKADGLVVCLVPLELPSQGMPPLDSEVSDPWPANPVPEPRVA